MSMTLIFLGVQCFVKVFLLSQLLCVTKGPIVMPCLCCFFSLCIFLTTESFGKCCCSKAHTLTVHFSIYCSLMLLLLLLLPLLTFTNVEVLLKRMACIWLTVAHKDNMKHTPREMKYTLNSAGTRALFQLKNLPLDATNWIHTHTHTWTCTHTHTYRHSRTSLSPLRYFASPSPVHL